MSSKSEYQALKGKNQELLSKVLFLEEKLKYYRNSPAFNYSNQTKDFFRILYGSMSDLVFEIDGKGTYLHIEPLLEYELRKIDASLVGKNLTDIFPAKQSEVFLDFIQRCLQSPKTLNIEYPLEIDGKIIWYEGRGTPKTKNSILFVARDITERKKIEAQLSQSNKKLAESEQWFKAITQQSSEGITVVDYKGKYVFANPAFCKMVAYSREELVDMEVVDLMKEKLPFIIEKHHFATSTPATLVRKDGSAFRSETIISPLQIGERKLLLGMVKDVSERTENRQQLINALKATAASERRFYDLFEKSGDAVLIMENNMIIDCNAATLKLFSWSSKKQVLNTEPKDFSPKFQSLGKDSESWQEYYIQKAMEQGFYNFEWLHTKDTGEVFPTEVSLTIISKENGVVLTHCIVRDISERKKAENELVSAKEKAEEGDRLKSAFLANMSHEIRTPLNGVLGFTHLLKEIDLEEADKDKYLKIIERGGFRLLNIINDLIDISKIEAGQMKVLSTKVALHEQMNYMEYFFQPEIALKPLNLSYINGASDEEVYVYTDLEKLLSILTNLIKNAIKYSNKGNIYFSYKKKGDFLEFKVQDEGMGISQEELSTIFDRFTQVNKPKISIEGAGLGLAITKAYVEILGGEIWVESELGKGSSFYFTLPNEN